MKKVREAFMRKASFFVARNSEKRLSGAVFNCLTYGKKVSTSIKSGDALPPEV